MTEIEKKIFSKDTLFEAILMTPYKLFPRQKEAVVSDSRFIRIIAGAGAGKTETLTRRIAYLFLYNDEPPSSIVAFTFTERAAKSMKSRVYQRVAELKGEKACANLGEMYIGTIHGYCLRILQDYFGYGNYDELDENQEMAFLMRHGFSLGLNKPGVSYAEMCGTFSRTANLVYDEMLDQNILEERADEFYQSFIKYESLLKKHRLLTFAQMINFAVINLRKNWQGISGIKHLIVDEYQDINKAQEKLIELIGKNSTLFVVGDPRQCIYRWRGSDDSYFDRFVSNHRDTHSITLTENTRSCQEIVDTANNVAFSFNSAEYEPMKKIRTEKGSFILSTCDSNLSEARWVIDQIEAIVARDKVFNYSDIAILLRSVNTSADPFIKSCKAKNIPYLVGGKVGLFRREEAVVVGCLYAYLADNGFWKKNPYSYEKITGEGLLDFAKELYGSLPLSDSFPVEAVKKWKENCLKGKFSNFTETYQYLFLTLRFNELNPQNELEAALLANLGRFNSILSDFESSIRRGGEKPDWIRVWEHFNWYLNSYASKAYEEQPADDIRGVAALQIMTVHQAKGLEWPVVFIPCMTSRRFPSSMSGRESYWLIPKDLFDYDRYTGGEEDERKLFYVSITRARDICCLSHHLRINSTVSPSHFLDCLGDGIKTIDEEENLPKTEIMKSDDRDEIQTFSGSEIIGYRRCPYFYCLRENWNYQAGLDQALGYGRSLHHCLRIASESIKNGADPEKAITKAIDEGFHLPYASYKAKENMLRDAKKKLKEYVKAHTEDMKNIEEVEARLEFPMEKATITGRVDVIIRDRENPAFEVRDYKTSKEITTFEESSLQVRLYSLGLRNMGRPVKKASIAYLDTGEVKDVKISEDRLKEAKEITEKCIRGIISSNYKVNHKNKYRCDYKKICRYSNYSGCTPTRG